MKMVHTFASRWRAIDREHAYGLWEPSRGGPRLGDLAGSLQPSRSRGRKVKDLWDTPAVSGADFRTIGENILFFSLQQTCSSFFLFFSFSHLRAWDDGLGGNGALVCWGWVGGNSPAPGGSCPSPLC